MGQSFVMTLNKNRVTSPTCF